ncbi:MAG: adenylate/guanylate cyclase domain-containing protein [Phycisphaeraceae bacterium]
MSDNLHIVESSRSLREDSEASRITREKLQQPIPVDLRANQLANVIEYLRNVTGANFVVQWRSLEAAGITKETPITMQLNNVAAERSLRLILDEAGGELVKLGYTIDEGVIVIATNEFLSAKTEIRTYDIRDLLPPINALADNCAKDVPREERIIAVMDLIRNSVARDSWLPVGLTGFMEELNGILIISTTTDNHHAIAQLLQQLRRHSPPSPSANATSGEASKNNLQEWAGDERLTLAIVFTDIVDSTALFDEIKDEAMIKVQETHYARGRKLIGEFHGRESTTLGDGFLAVFRTADLALDFAMALHGNSGHPRVRIRAGIHIGPVTIKENEVSGRTVIVTARVAKATQNAEIWLSEQAKRDIDELGAEKHKHLQWEKHEGKKMKGISGLVTLWSLVV